MAYTLTYRVAFTNEQNQEVIASIYKKDGAIPDEVQDYMCSSLEISDKSEGQTKYESTIITRELIMAIWTEEADEITWETFITAEHDEWKIIVMVDEQLYFEGFITPDEGNAAFQDKPYEVIIKATNGLSLLKGTDLVDINGDDFDSDHTLIEYIAGALKQTGLSLPIRVRCAYFNEQMNDKGVSLSNDMFAQAKLNYRTFQATATTFVSCFDALMIILDKFCRLEYWNGYWQIKCIGELQYIPNLDYYVDYNSNGGFAFGNIESENHAQIGKAVDIYPINEDQQIYSRFAVKSAKTKFNYEIWPELPKNNKFERGTEFESGDAVDTDDLDNDGNTSEVIGTYKKYTIDDMEQGIVDLFDLPHPAMVATSSQFYRRSIYNDFGIEIKREIMSDTEDLDSNHDFWLRTEGVPVYIGDKIKIGLSKRFSNDFSGGGTVFTIPAVVYIVVGGDAYYLDNNISGAESGTGRWRQAVNLAGQLILDFAPNQNTTKYGTLSVESLQIPFDGTLYIAFKSDGPSGSTGPFQYFNDFTFEYIPFTAGGYVKVDGDYWLRSQNKVYPDVADEEVRISDSTKKLFKGSLLVGSDLAEPTWFRYGLLIPPFMVTERRQFKELLNIARFNHSYRRMYALEGTFNGLNFSPENNQLVKYPIGFHKRYRLMDISPSRDFVLVPPLKMDLIKGWASLNLVEVINTANSDDGTQAGDSSSFNYIFNTNG
jgi:hypothetical protein